MSRLLANRLRAKCDDEKKTKFTVGDTVDFDGMTGEIIGIYEYDNEFDWTPDYRIKVKSDVMSDGFAIFQRTEEQLIAYHD